VLREKNNNRHQPHSTATEFDYPRYRVTHGLKTSTLENLFTIKRRLSEFGSCLADTADLWGQRTIGVVSHRTEQKRTIQTSTQSSQHDSILVHHLIHKRSLNHIREANSFKGSDLYEFHYSYPVPARHGLFLLFLTTQHYSFVLLLIYT
jgi:hypothetical protein